MNGKEERKQIADVRDAADAAAVPSPLEGYGWQEPWGELVAEVRALRLEMRALGLQMERSRAR